MPAIVVTINKNDSEEVIREKLEKLNNEKTGKKGFPAYKFTGKVKSFGDGLEYQKKIRDEWERISD
jgi:hypothetical protein